MKLAKIAGVAVLAVFLSAAAAWAQCQGGCCGGKKAEAKETPEKAEPKPISLTLPVRGGANGGLEKSLSEIKAIEKIEVKHGSVTLTIRKRSAIKLSEIEAALKSAEAELVRVDLKLTGSLALKVTGMSCGGCVPKLEKGVSRIPGLSGLKVDDPKGGKVRATLKDVPYGALAKAVKDAGFSLEDVSWYSCCGSCKPGEGCCGSCGNEKSEKKPDCESCKKTASCCGNCGDKK